MMWINLALTALVGGLGLILVGSFNFTLERRLRPFVALAFNVFGIIVVTWLLLSFARDLRVSGAQPPLFRGPALSLLDAPITTVIVVTATRSLLLMGLAGFWATVVGLGAAVYLAASRQRRLGALALVASILWILPTFLFAILVQEFQAFIAGRTGLLIAAGFGTVNAVQIFWASIVLGLRPACYLFRHVTDALDLELTFDYVRTARAKGLPWRRVVQRHIVRASAAKLLAIWLNSFRQVIGSLPLVEYFFGYPGLGRVLVLALGVSQGRYVGEVRGDLAGALVVTMAAILVTAEALVALLKRRLDPRQNQAELIVA